MSEFKFILDTGRTIFIHAKTRKDAVEKICQIYGMGKDWLKEHCRIVRMGRVKNNDIRRSDKHS